MCDSIANGGYIPAPSSCCPPANVIIASNVLATNGNVLAGNIISQDGTFSGNLYVSGQIYGTIVLNSINVAGQANVGSVQAGFYFGNASGISNLNASNIQGSANLTNLYVTNSVTTTNVFFQNSILSTNLPTFNGAQGTWGTGSNVARITIDQYGRISAATNVSITSSQWTTVQGNVAYQNGVSIGTLTSPPVGSNLYVLGTSNIDVINVSYLYGLSTINISGISNLNSVVTSVANVGTLNVSSLETTGNLSIYGNVIPVTKGNTYFQGNVVVAGNVYSSLGQLGVGGSLYFSIGGAYTPSSFTGNIPTVGTTTYALRTSAFTPQGASTFITTSANGCFQFSQTGVYTIQAVFRTGGNNVLGMGIGSNVIDYGSRTDQTYLYSTVPFITQNPTEILEASFYVGSTSLFYYIDVFAIDSIVLQPTVTTGGGTWFSIAPLGGVGAASQTITLSTLGTVITGRTTSYGASINDYYIGMIVGNTTVTLPIGSSLAAGKQYIIKDEAGVATTAPVIVAASGLDTIDGTSSAVLSINYASVTVLWTGTKWVIV